MLNHGGNVHSAAKQYGISVADLLDLSTGINPNGWPVPINFPSSIWSQLPQNDDGMLDIAQHYYQCQSLLAVAGSQIAIQNLPYLRTHSRVGVFSPAYAEHQYQWQQAGHNVITITPANIDAEIKSLDVLIIINPNNPTGIYFDKQQLLDWHQQLTQHNGWLIVDEAFIDLKPAESLSPYCPQTGLIVLRSIGKFFGLAGIRSGFVLADESLLQALAERIGPWSLSHPSRHITGLVLADIQWQESTREHLQIQGERLYNLLESNDLKPTGGCSLFQWIMTPLAVSFHQQLASNGVLTRLFEQPKSLRFGLPKRESDWQHLQKSLQRLKH